MGDETRVGDKERMMRGERRVEWRRERGERIEKFGEWRVRIAELRVRGGVKENEGGKKEQ